MARLVYIRCKRTTGYFIHFLAILLGWNMLYCDATVNVSLINSADGEDSIECGSDGVVSCRIDPYANLINWVINDTPYVTCSSGCIVNPTITRSYSPTYDFTNGIFNLTVDSVTYNDNNTTFKCDDGSLSDNVTIAVVPAYSENKTNINVTDGGKRFEFTTTCVQPGVEFEWFIVKTDNSGRERYNKGQNEMTESTICSMDSDCGGVGTVKVSSIIKIQLDSGGVERYIEVDVKYKNPNEKKTFRFDEIFLIEVQDCELHCGIIIFLIYVVRFVLLLLLFFVGSLLCGLWDKSIKGFVCVCLGIFPLIGICSACVLFPIRKELCCWKSIIFIICFVCDISSFVLMILTCTDTMEKPCNFYVLYAFIAIIFPWTNFGCLEKCQQKQKNLEHHSNSQTSNKTEKKQTVSCWECKTRKTEQIPKTKCDRCDVYLCEECRQKHIKGHLIQEEIDKNCRCLRSRNKSELYCLRCKQYLCKWCKPIHALHGIISHSQQETNETLIPCNLCDKNDLKDAKYYSSDYRKFVCEDCQSQRGLKDIIAIDDYYFHSENNVESYCLSCHQYVCTLCFTKHADDNILRHSQQEAGEKRCQIFCKMCKKEATKKRGKYCKIGDKFFVCEDCKSKKDLKDIFAIDDYYFHSENNIESYCLKCKQILCTICYSKHAKHRRIIRHFQHEASKERCHIFCKFCLQIDKRTDAKYMSYNEGDDRIFVCEDCKTELVPYFIVAIDEMELEQLDQDLKCKEGCNENPVECYCMIEGKNMCAACLNGKRKQSDVLQKWKKTETRQTEQVKLCALHSVAGLPLNQNDASESHADVLCLFCNEYLCKMCFKQHLDIKQLWRTQHRYDKWLDKQTSRLTILLLEPENIHDGLRNNEDEQRSLNIQTTEF